MSQGVIDGLSFFLIAGYAFPLAFFSLRNKILNKTSKEEPSTHNRFSIIIPFRNEAERIDNCLKSLELIDYPRQNFELLFVNDHSQDGGKEVIVEWQSTSGTSSILIDLEDNLVGKKAAIKSGVNQSQFDYIITLDADCEVKPKWLSTYNEIINKRQNAILISGPVMIKAKGTFLNYIESFDFAAMVSFGALTMNMGKATITNGANLCFQKQAYLKAAKDLNSDLTPSGDDVFLLHAFKQIDNCEIYYLNDSNSLVLTEPTKSWKDLFSQKIRWASKAKFYKDLFTIFSSFWLLLVQFATVFCILLLFYSKKGDFSMIFLAFLFKTIAETLFMYPLLKQSNRIGLLTLIVPFQIIYPLYISGIAILAQIFSFQWKGRVYK